LYIPVNAVYDWVTDTAGGVTPSNRTGGKGDDPFGASTTSPRAELEPSIASLDCVTGFDEPGMFDVLHDTGALPDHCSKPAFGISF